MDKIIDFPVFVLSLNESAPLPSVVKTSLLLPSEDGKVKYVDDPVLPIPVTLISHKSAITSTIVVPLV
jgi:hypothetical protein